MVLCSKIERFSERYVLILTSSKSMIKTLDKYSNMQLTLTFRFDRNTSHFHLSSRTLPCFRRRSRSAIVRLYKVSRDPTSVDEHGRSIGTLEWCNDKVSL